MYRQFTPSEFKVGGRFATKARRQAYYYNQFLEIYNLWYPFIKSAISLLNGQTTAKPPKDILNEVWANTKPYFANDKQDKEIKAWNSIFLDYFSLGYGTKSEYINYKTHFFLIWDMRETAACIDKYCDAGPEKNNLKTCFTCLDTCIKKSQIETRNPWKELNRQLTQTMISREKLNLIFLYILRNNIRPFWRETIKY